MNNLTLNIYKAFGIWKASNLYSIGYNYTDFDTHFKTPRRAMAAAIRRVRQESHDEPHIALTQEKQAAQRFEPLAFIQHPNGGINRLSIHPETGALTLNHVTHGAYQMDKGKDYTPKTHQEKLTSRDVGALDRMKHLHRNSILSLGDTPMHIDTWGLYDLPEELHTGKGSEYLSESP